MISWHLKLGVALVAASTAAIGGYRYGSDKVQARWDSERAKLIREHAKDLEALLSRQAAAQREAQATETRLQAALRKARNEPKQRIECPQSGDVRDAIVPGLADRLRSIDAAAASAPAGS